MKILMILSNPFVTDGRVTKEAKALVEDGHEVTVVVWDRKHEYKSFEYVDCVMINRIHNTLFMRLLPNVFIRNPLWWKKAYKKGLEIYENGFDFDVVHCHDLDTLKTGVKLKKKLGCKLIYDAHEIFGYMVMDTLGNTFTKLIFWWEKHLVKHADHIITVSEPVKEYLKTITHKSITVVMNCKDIINKSYQSTKNDSMFSVCYIGSFVKSRMFPELVDIIGDMKDIKFIVAGTKSALYDEIKVRSGRYNNVVFLGQIPANDVMLRTLNCDALICMFDPERKAHQIGLPNKVFEAMVVGRPIIVTKDLYYSTEFVEKEKCGLSVSNNGISVQDAILKLKQNPNLCERLGRNGLEVALNKYNWNEQKNKLLNVYESLMPFIISEEEDYYLKEKCRSSSWTI